LIKQIYFFGTSHTAGGGFEFDSSLKSFRIEENDFQINETPRGELLKKIYSKLYLNEELTQENFSFPGQFRQLCRDRNIDVEVINISKQGYGNERIYRKFYDIIKQSNFNPSESLFVFEFSDIERAELYYKPLDNHVIINYYAVNRNFYTNDISFKNEKEIDFVELSGYAKSYWYETPNDLTILKNDKKFFEEYVEKTLDAKNRIHVLNYNNINFLSFLKLNNFNFLISEMHNGLYSELEAYYSFLKDHLITFYDYKNTKYNGFLDLVHKNKLLIANETEFNYTDNHPSFTANKIIAKNIFNHCVNQNYIETQNIQITKSDFKFPKLERKSIF
jgi:hypothetical protein